VTPAHDPDDWQIGQRHDLPIINVMAPDGSISDKFGWDDAAGSDAEQFLGMDRFEAREAIIEWFRTENLLEDVREYTHEVGHSYRSHVPIEPYLSDQWYIAVKKQIPSMPDEGTIEDTDVPVNSLAGLALKPLLEGRVKFTPERYAKTYQNWIENLRDWPISRQLWWGHRIPIWSKEGKVALNGKPTGLILREIEGENGTVAYACVAPGCEDIEKQLEEDGFQRDPDVLDTWFSSALWPISTMGWPEETDLLNTFYPTDLLCTAREIITLWVTRMVMFGQYFRGDIPFSQVYIHAMIQDGAGRKMSKSLGNGIDPLDIIASHGADAMRFTLTSMTTETQDVRMPVSEMTLPDGRQANTSAKFDIGRNFCNKLWNASRFAMMNLEAMPAWSEIHPKENLSDRWILSRLNATVRDATAAIEAFRFNELVDTLYRFMWSDFCDWYLEIAKIRINTGNPAARTVLAHCLDVLLRLLHPVVPFITEQIWSQLNQVAPNRGPGDSPAEEMLITARWPLADAVMIDTAVEEKFELYREAVRGVRNIRAEHNVPPKQPVTVSLDPDSNAGKVVMDNCELFVRQITGETVDAAETVADRGDAGTFTVGGAPFYVLGVIDIEAERARLTRQADTIQNGVTGIEKKLANEKFLANAPSEVVGRERERLATMKKDLDAVTESLKAL
ncbi:MAG: class I tRNA ligase family protein, partial [Phycisphaerae bacterium]|nr:class I tRNA ligase family protein [Phycisphaerae bacterium]